MDQESQQSPKLAKNSATLISSCMQRSLTRGEGIVTPSRCFAAMEQLLTTDEMLLDEAGLDHCRGQVRREGGAYVITILGV